MTDKPLTDQEVFDILDAHYGHLAYLSEHEEYRAFESLLTPIARLYGEDDEEI